MNELTEDEKRIVMMASVMRWISRALMRSAQFMTTADRKRHDWMHNTPIGSLVFEASSGHEDHDRIGHVVALSDQHPNGDRDCVTIRVLATGEIKRWHNAVFVRIPSNAAEFREFEGLEPLDDRYVCSCAICTRAKDAICELCGSPRNA